MVDSVEWWGWASGVQKLARYLGTLWHGPWQPTYARRVLELKCSCPRMSFGRLFVLCIGDTAPLGRMIRVCWSCWLVLESRWWFVSTMCLRTVVCRWLMTASERRRLWCMKDELWQPAYNRRVKSIDTVIMLIYRPNFTVTTSKRCCKIAFFSMDELLRNATWSWMNEWSSLGMVLSQQQ